jgi:hypothetical protein
MCDRAAFCFAVCQGFGFRDKKGHGSFFIWFFSLNLLYLLPFFPI